MSIVYRSNLKVSAGTAYIKGDGPGNLGFALKAATLSGETLTMTLISESPLPDEVALFDPFTITWEYALESAAASWVEAGISENQIYVTLGMPVSGTTVYHTLAHLGCKNAQGQSDEASIIEAIWGEFTDLTVRHMDGTPLFYWGPYAVEHEIYYTKDLLKHADGRCGAWARFLVDMLKVQGIDIASIKTIKTKDIFIGIGLGFHVKNWDIDVSPPLPLEGVEAQGINEDPSSKFANHAVVTMNGSEKIYDHSYGKDYADLTAWEDASLDLLGYRNRVTGEEFVLPNTLGDEQTEME